MMNHPTRGHIARCVVVVTTLYILARLAGWTGPDARVRLDPDSMTIPILLVTAWALYRLNRNSRGGGRP